MLSLPTDLILRIYLLLGASDALALTQVNHFFHGLYRESLEVQYHVKCRLAGVDNNPKCDLPISTRLQMLREKEKAWRTCSPKSIETVEEPHRSSHPHDLSRSHYHIGKTTPYAAGPNGVMSCALRTENEERWSTFHVDDMADFACCIEEHDLLICVTCTTRSFDVQINAHIFQYSTLSPHPEATSPMFPICRQPLPSPHAPDIEFTSEIAGDHLILAISYPKIDDADINSDNESDINITMLFDYFRLIVLNWRTGEICHQPLVFSYPGESIPGIAMLRHDIFILPSFEGLKGECLDIYHIPTVDLDSMGSIRLIGRLKLPEPKYDYCAIDCRAAPNPTKDGSFPTYVPSSVPFIESPENALILFQLSVECDDSSFTADFTMVVHRHALLNLLPPDSELDCESYFEASWEEWGPDRTHWFEVDHGKSYTTGVNGQRYVFSGGTEIRSGQNVKLLDFNPFNVKRATKVQHKSVLRNPVFAYQLESRLPYAEILSKEKYTYDSIMINDKAVIAKKSHTDYFHVFHFE